MNPFILSQYLYRYAAVTNFANSKELAITITDILAPANNLDSPNTEKNAALNATNSADNPKIVTKCLDRSKKILPLLFYK